MHRKQGVEFALLRPTGEQVRKLRRFAGARLVCINGHGKLFFFHHSSISREAQLAWMIREAATARFI